MSKSPAKSEYIVLQSNHTPAVDIAGTAVAEAIHKAHPEKRLIVTTNFPEVWLHNPHVWRVYKLGQTPYFFEDFVEGRDTQIFIHDPVKSSDFINGTNHLIKVWCDMCEVPYNNEKPALYFTQRESEVAMRMTQSERPLFFIQPYEMHGAVSQTGWSWPKDLPTDVAAKIVNKMVVAGYQPVLIKNQNQPAIAGAGILQMNLRLALAALQYSSKRLFVDSFMQAAAAALGKPSVVTWLSTHPQKTGYNMHTNIVARIDTDLKNILDQYHPLFDIDNKMINSHVDTSRAYDVDAIIKALLQS